MELPKKILQQITFKTTPKNEEHIMIVMDESTHGEHLAHPLLIKKIQYKIAVTFLICYNGFFNVKAKKIKFCFVKTNTDKNEFIQKSIPKCEYELESLNDEIKTIFIDEVFFTEADCRFTIKSNFSTLGSILEIFRHKPLISFLPGDCIRYFLGFSASTISEEYNLSPNPVDIVSSDNFFIECNNAQEVIFRESRIEIIHNWTMTVDSGYKFVGNFAGGISWYLIKTSIFISSICFILKIEINELVSINGQSITFRLSNKKFNSLKNKRQRP